MIAQTTTTMTSVIEHSGYFRNVYYFLFYLTFFFFCSPTGRTERMRFIHVTFIINYLSDRYEIYVNEYTEKKIISTWIEKPTL